jgi:hypothetical protein
MRCGRRSCRPITHIIWACAKLSKLSDPEQKSRATARRGHGCDLDYYAAQAEEEGRPFDEDAICAAMEYKQTWTDVSKIRLVRERAYLDGDLHRRDFCTRCYVELVRQGEDGEETVRIGRRFSLCCISNLPGNTSMQIFADRLSEELHLRRAFVNGVDEYAV